MPDKENKKVDNSTNQWRAKVNKKKGQRSKYSVGDRVNYDPGGRSMLVGPFLIDEVLDGQQYILCYESDRSVAYNGTAVEEDRLVRA
ncbi:hypothetical protein GLAREA_12620 [Glarea lozoyensis ATCC 20868]|uniref:Uncharacterized protein n=1 Tax=Glarea lozoyensis (strain ATCC 20868 / MF5171) TaxID=1116229 RepID=S3CYH1_GLAL2|nr:uncharacterized protein GLAREA_12620 [Glarea lozoyensis ATCC 20868]EPE31317.1 hypothetical protein GLAREA_12620 [Glarea lozoyensis ATCC 20868]